MKYKLSFLMAVHNEEKLIRNALKRLVEIHKDYPNIEVLIGLDGCTDKTPEIVKEFSKKYKFFKIFDLNERKGKQAVLDKLNPHAKGDIIIIHDGDWSFIYKTKKDLLDFLSVFDDPKIGGIAESIDSEMSKPNFWKINSIGFLASAWGNHFLLNYYKKKFTIRKGNIRIYNRKKIKFYPWLDFYKKDALEKTRHKQELRAGDHIERTLRLFDAGYEIASYDNENWPHFIENYNKQSIRGLVNQKIRGNVSKKKLQSSYDFNISFFEFKLPFLFYLIKNSFKVKRFKDFLAIQIYILAMFYASLIGKIKQKASVKEIWGKRIRR